MQLPIAPPLEPMLARAVPDIPEGMTYEPKWDGFRCIIFRDGDEVVLSSRGGKSLSRYFPEAVAAAREALPDRCVVDGELVVIRRDGTIPRLDFDCLGQRIHPAASRVAMLAETTPASFVAFDLLAFGDHSLLSQPYQTRRSLLEEALADVPPPTYLTPVTTDRTRAQEWFEVFEGAGLDGIIAKPADIPYAPGKRLMYKVKHVRTADVVVAGFRWHKNATEPAVGSLLLGLYDSDGRLHHIGVCGAFSAARRRELVDEVEGLRSDVDNHPWRLGEQEWEPGQRVPGGVSRWTGQKDLSWVPLRPEWVIEVGYSAMEGDRLRHTAQFQRSRPDRDPLSCRYDQLEQPLRFDVDEVLGVPPRPAEST